MPILLLAASPVTRTPALRPKEDRIAEQVDGLNPAGLALLERVVNFNSGTMNFAGVRAVGMVFKAELDALGVATRREFGSPYRRAGPLVPVRLATGWAPIP